MSIRHAAIACPIRAALNAGSSLLLGYTGFCWSGAPSVIATCASLLICAAAFLTDHRWGLWLSVGSVLHVHGGLGLGLYQTAPWFDVSLHILLMAWLVTLVLDLSRLATTTWTRHARVAAATLSALGLGAAWELFEAALDSLFVLGAQPDLQDTNLDLAADLAGGLVASLSLRRGLEPEAPAVCAFSNP